MKKDKIQEAYDKMLNEGLNYTFHYMSKANDNMAYFLEELGDAAPGPKEDKKIWKEYLVIEKDWENLWDKIVKLAKQL